MKAGSTMTSRDSQEVRHIITARQARAGRPRCSDDAPSAASSSSTHSASALARNCVLIGNAASSASASVTTRPWAAPASVVKNTTDQAGFIRLHPPRA